MKKIWFIALFPLLLNCWDRQDHDVTRPIIPNYIFDGTAVDMDTGEMMPGAQIKLKAEHMLYEVNFGTQIITADSTGYFKFDSVYPGDYQLSYERNSYFIGNDRFTLGHADTSRVIEIPQLYFGQEFEHHRSNYPVIASSGSVTWVNIFWWGSRIGNQTSPFYDSDMFMIYKFENSHWFQDSKIKSVYDTRPLSGMTFIREGLMTCMSNDTLYKINRWDASANGKYPIDHIARGVALHVGHACIYTCLGSKLYRHNPEDPSVVDEIYETDLNNLSSLAYYRNLYAFDRDKALLLKFDNDMNIITHYALLNTAGIQIKNVYDMSFDGYAKLWYTIK